MVNHFWTNSVISCHSKAMNRGNGVVFGSRAQGWRGFDGFAIGKMYVADGESVVDDEIRAPGVGNGWFCKKTAWHRFRPNCHSRAVNGN